MMDMILNVTSIVECDFKELKQILSESVKLAINFEELTEKIIKPQQMEEYAHVLIDYVSQIKGISFISDNTLAKYEKLKEQLSDKVTWKYWVNYSLKIPTEYEQHIRLPGGIIPSKKKNIEWLQNIANIYNKEVEEYQLNLAKAAQNLNNSVFVKYIPPDYRYSLALSTMLGFINNMRASNWKECVNLYEEQLHRWRLEVNSAECLELQRQTKLLAGQAKNNAAISAIFSGLNLFLK